MANKGLATRQKMRLRIEPSQQALKPRNPVAQAAMARAAGSHAPTIGAQRQADKQALKKVKLEPEEE